MAPTDIPSDEDKQNFNALKDALVSKGKPDGDLSELNDEDNHLESLEDNHSSDSNEYLSKIETPTDKKSIMDDGGLRGDTLEFELVSRRSKARYGGLKIILAGCLIVSAGYTTWAYWGDEFFGLNVDEVPIVRAPRIPVKVRPKKPGGIEIPNRDIFVYDRLERMPPQGTTENLLPRPERPLSPPEANLSSKSMAATKLNSSPEPPKTIGSQPAVAEVLAIQKPKPSLSMANIKKKQDKSVSAVLPKPKLLDSVNREALIVKKENKSATNNFQIQLLAVRSAAAVEKEWVRLKKKHISLLGKLSLNVVRVNLGEKGVFYRLHTGPLANKGTARALCDALIKVKVACLVIRPNKSR